MADVNITSHNQQGGITAQTVNSSGGPLPPPEPKKRNLWPIVVGIFSILGVIIAILTYLGLKPKGV